MYAYVLREGGAGVQGRVRYSDDGEPQKTAGLPTLEVIQHAGLTDVITVVTRYFGGVLLGTGGLVRAYTQATQAGIEAAELVVVSRCVDIEGARARERASRGCVLSLAAVGAERGAVACAMMCSLLAARCSLLAACRPRCRIILQRYVQQNRAFGSLA